MSIPASPDLVIVGFWPFGDSSRMPCLARTSRFNLAAGLFLLFLLCLACPAAQPDANSNDTDVPYGIADWPEALGNHRARVGVSKPAQAVWVRIPWRRRDERPEQKEILVIDAATNLRVTNITRVSINQEFGDLLFAPPTAPGEYFIYYLPFKREGWWAFPTTIYWTPTNTADTAWLTATAPLQRQIIQNTTNHVPAARVLEIQAINDFNRRDPMELVATARELESLLAKNAGKPYLVFPEDRTRPIRMTDKVPLRWVRRGPTSTFAGEALRGEFYTFQLGLFAPFSRQTTCRSSSATCAREPPEPSPLPRSGASTWEALTGLVSGSKRRSMSPKARSSPSGWASRSRWTRSRQPIGAKSASGPKTPPPPRCR